MSNYIFVLLFGLVCTINCDSSSSSDKYGEEWRRTRDFNQANFDFTAKCLYNVIDEEPNKNAITSPLSVLMLLSQLALYAKGKAYQQLADVLNLKKRNDIRSTIPQYLDEINNQEKINISLVGRVFGSIDYPFSKKFKRDTKRTFQAQAKVLDFSEPEKAAKDINLWIASETNNLIKDFIPATSLNEDTRLVLADALYFRGSWESPFDPKRTKSLTFHVTNRRMTLVKMMNQIRQFKYGYIENIESKVVQIPYRNENFSLLSILPDKRLSVHTVADLLQDMDLENDIIDNLGLARVNVSMPVIHAESTIDIADILNKIGVTALFDTNSDDLSGILKYPEPIYVTNAIQKAKIVIDEVGSEAAAASRAIIGPGFTLRNLMKTVETFNANRPFLYYVLFGGAPIFAGMYVGPQ